MKLRALIFDVDGTLAETEELHRRAFNDAFAAAGLHWHWNEQLYRDLLRVTGGKERIRHYIEHYAATPVLDGGAIRDLHGDKTARYTANVAAGGLEHHPTRRGHPSDEDARQNKELEFISDPLRSEKALALRPGVTRLISEARDAGLRMAVATTTSRDNVDALLAAAFGANPFEIIAAGDEVPAKKPAPDIYRLALQRLGLPASECLAIEDSANGLLSARAAGIACVVTRSVYGGDGPFDDAMVVLNDLDDPQASLSALKELHAACHAGRGANRSEA